MAAHLMALAFLRYLLRVAQQQLLTQSFPTWESSIVSLPQLYHPQKMCQAEVVRAGGLPVWQCPRELLQRAWCLPHAGGPWRWPGGSCELHHLLNLLPVKLTLSGPWKWGEGNTDTRTERTTSDYKESLIVCVLYCDNAEGKGESLAASSEDFLQGWFESEERRLLFFSFWCSGCSEPVLYQHGCRMQVDVSLGGYVDICT